ncbi:hypothetical protein N7475_005004 [Penicillium sp. IBT 31633x]|nr:hypothetical protein N7475_005004 [Penicillium sp. IBT 31633x]
MSLRHTRLKSGQEIPEPERGGKHKRACDSCANLRKACSGESPCAECTQREKQCTYQRLRGDDPPFPPASQDSSENRNAEKSAVDDGHPKGSERNWDLGPATLYPPVMTAFARRHSIALDSSGGPIEI